MTNALLQVMVTIWIGAHPVTYTLPTIYAGTGDKCFAAASRIEATLLAHRRYKAIRVEAGCYEAFGRDA